MKPAGKFSIGLVQMACSVDPRENLEKAAAKVGEAARAGARIVCLPELFRSRYFCQREDPAVFDLAEPVPGPTTEALAEAARRHGVAVVAPVFERRAPGLYHNSAAVIDADGRIARALPQDAHPRRSRLLRKVLLHAGRPRLPRLRHRGGQDRDAHLLGPVVSRGRRGWRRSRGRASSSIRRRSAGIRTRRRSTARRSATPGARSSAATRSPTASTSPRSTASGHEKDAEGGGAGIEFWGSSFVAIRRGSSWPRPRRTAKRSSSPRSTWRASRTCAATGPSCATGASTPTAGSRALPRRGGREQRPLTMALTPTLSPREREKIPPARRVGAARGDVDRLAAQPDRLARPVRPDPLGLRGDRPQARARRASCGSSSSRRRTSSRRVACSRGPAWTRGGSSSSAFRRTGDGRATRDPRSCGAAGNGRRSRSAASGSTAGRSTTTGRRMTPSRRKSPVPSACRSCRRASRAGSSCSKGARSTSTARGRSSRRKSACSMRRRRCATPA